MKAEDTVMSIDTLIDFMPEDYIPYGILSAIGQQAEISFKAGFIEGQKQRDQAAFNRGKQAGIKEVVDWVESHMVISPDEDSLTQFYPYYIIEVVDKQAKLKEWGIEL